MDSDIRDAIERSIGDGPAQPAPELLLARGRRALWRRRLVEAGSAVAAGALVVTVTVLAAHGTTDRAAPRPVDPASATATTQAKEPSSSPSRTDADRAHFPGPDAAFISDRGVTPDWAISQQRDGLHVSPRMVVVRFEDDPWGVRPKAWSIAMIYRTHGVAYYYAGYIDASYGGQSTSISAANAGLPFDAWVRDQKELYGAGRGGGGQPSGGGGTPDGRWPGISGLQLVRFDGASQRLTPLDAVSMLEQRPHPDLPESWAGATDRSAVAEVRFEGVRYYVLARATGDSAPQYIAVTAARGGATLDDFLDLARRRYGRDGGGLL